MRKNKLVYIASPLTKGNQSLNVRFQLNTFDKLYDLGYTPFAPLWDHFQNMLTPRSWKAWMTYDLEIVARCDAVLRLDADLPEYNYKETRSRGADFEVKFAKERGIPVVYSIEELESLF